MKKYYTLIVTATVFSIIAGFYTDEVLAILTK
jgi:hypothetical protein